MPDDPATLAAKFTPTDVKLLACNRQSTTARFSPCGKMLAVAGTDALLRRWKAEDEAMPELPPIVGHNGWITSLAFAASGGLLLATDSWGRLAAWRFEEEKPTAAWNLEAAHDGWIRAIALSPDGATLATCGRDRAVKLWNAADGTFKQELPLKDQDVYAMVFHPTANVLVTGDSFGVIRHWDLAAMSVVRTLDAKSLYLLSRLQDVGGVYVLRFSPDAKMLVAGGGKPSVGGFTNASPTLLGFDWDSGELKHTITLGTDGQGFVFDLSWNATGFWMGVISGLSGEGKFFFQRLEDAAPFFVRGLPNCHSLAVHPNGRRLGVLHTNGGSNANGRQLQEGKYTGNFSPIQILDLPPV